MPTIAILGTFDSKGPEHGFLADCIRGQRLLPMEEAVRLITDVPARYFGLNERGQLREGWVADVVLLLGVRFTDVRKVWLPPFTSSHAPPNWALPLGVSAIA